MNRFFAIAFGTAFTAVLTMGCGGAKGKSRDDGPGTPEGGKAVEGATWSDAQGVQIVPTWTSGPFANDWSSVELAVFDKNGEVAPGVQITEVKPWMTVHGHGAPVKKMTVSQGVGGAGEPARHVWSVDKLFFTMSGKWDLIVTAKVPSSPYAEQTTTLEVEVP